MTTVGWIFSILGTIIILGLLVVGIVWVVTWLSSGGPRVDGASSASAKEILDRRLARGEISVQQYEQLRRTLGEPPSQAPGTSPAHGG